MKYFIALSLVPCLYFPAFSQENKKLIEAFLSNPQPRINQYSSIVINPIDLIDTLFNALPEADRANIIRMYCNELRIGSIKMDKPGKYTIGPMHFVLNQTSYSTSEINYEVIDSLPNTDKGLWIRKVMISDSVFCLIMEQRIPYSKKIASGKSFQYPSYEEQMQRAVFTVGQYEKVLIVMSSGSSSVINSLTIDGVEKSFIYSETYSFIRIDNKMATITLSKENFINLPGDYHFQNIHCGYGTE